jgi:hypothetical protein
MVRTLNPLRWVCVCLATVALVVVSPAIWAQGVTPNADTGVKAGSLDTDFTIGWSNIPTKLDPSDTNNHPNLGGSFGVNLTNHVGVVGEYKYQLMAPLDGVAFNTQLFGGALRYSFGGHKVVPYVVLGGGGARLTGSESGVTATANGGYFGTGAGASLFLGKNWGIRPEFRYDYLHLSLAGVTQNANITEVSTGLFFQFGGTSSRSQLASSRP